MKIPELNWQNFQIASNGHPELGIPAEYLTAPINRELDRYQGLIRDTDSMRIGARVTPDHLWLSAISTPTHKIIGI